MKFREESRKGIAKKEVTDLVPINYENHNGWYTFGKAITTRTTDEAKAWRKEFNSYCRGITNKDQKGYQYHERESFPTTYKRVMVPRKKRMTLNYHVSN